MIHKKNQATTTAARFDSMKFPENTAPSTADWSDTVELQRRLSETVEAMAAMADEVGMAKQIREFNSDQRKRVLAVAAMPLIKAGQSATAADTEGRASEPYQAAMKQLAKELIAAEQTIARYEVLKLTWETARSLLSLTKETMRQL